MIWNIQEFIKGPFKEAACLGLNETYERKQGRYFLDLRSLWALRFITRMNFLRESNIKKEKKRRKKKKKKKVRKKKRMK